MKYCKCSMLLCTDISDIMKENVISAEIILYDFLYPNYIML